MINQPFAYCTGMVRLYRLFLDAFPGKTVNAREMFYISKGNRDIPESESKKNFLIEAEVIEQFQFPPTPLKISARPIFARKLL